MTILLAYESYKQNEWRCAALQRTLLQYLSLSSTGFSGYDNTLIPLVLHHIAVGIICKGKAAKL